VTTNNGKHHTTVTAISSERERMRLRVSLLQWLMHILLHALMLVLTLGERAGLRQKKQLNRHPVGRRIGAAGWRRRSRMEKTKGEMMTPPVKCSPFHVQSCTKTISSSLCPWSKLGRRPSSLYSGEEGGWQWGGGWCSRPRSRRGGAASPSAICRADLHLYQLLSRWPRRGRR
jgi:hypothetical protein